ncbi:MAG: DUF3179 domain-containing protein [Phycisphaerales bacterium]|nr:DUF3179 domain-containing protein [Phycisphaerales bacterium]
MTDDASAKPRSSTTPLLLTVFLVLIGAGSLLSWGIISAVRGPSRAGDGVHPESYGFDLSGLLIETEALQTSGNPRDFLVAYVEPSVVVGTDVAGKNESRSRSWQKEVVSDDRVIGVEINGESRAYPLFIMNAHEVVLDELGGVPIAVTYSPLLDAVSVFDRQVDDSVLDFGVSGLLADGNTLYYDMSESPSLFSQLQGRAVSGPLAGTTLRRIPGVSIDRWKHWRVSHPETTVVLREPNTLGRYKRISYERYFDGRNWLIPPRKPPTPDAKVRVLAARPVGGTEWVVFSMPVLKAQADDSGVVERMVGSQRLRLRFDPGDVRTNSVEVLDAEGIELIPSLRIAWHGIPLEDEDAVDPG